MILLLFNAVVFGLWAWETAAVTFEEQCLTTKPEDAGIVNATITQHAFVAANTTISLVDNDATCAQASQAITVDLCRMAMNITTSDTSSVIVEIWLPEAWNGRLVTTGNGGLAGCKCCSPGPYRWTWRLKTVAPC